MADSAQQNTGPPAAPLELTAQEERRQRLKAAGEAYFAKVLSQSKGKDLLTTTKTAPGLGGGNGGLGAGIGAGAQLLPVTTFDEDFLQAGAVIEGARTYVLGTIFVAAQAVQLVFLKASLTALPMPAFLAFLHYLPSLLLIMLLATQNLLELRPFSLRMLQGGAVPAVLGGLQMLTLFWALLHCPVFVVLCWVTAAPHVLRATFNLLADGRRPPGGRLVALLVGLGCTASALMAQLPGALGLLGLLLWTASETAATVWEQLRSRPDLLAALGGGGGSGGSGTLGGLGALLHQALEAEALLDAASLAAVRHALPLLPFLLLGLLMREGRDLVDHELSVPTVSMILLSCMAASVALAAELLMAGGLTRQAHAALVAAGPLGTVVTEAAVHGISSPIGLVAAIGCSIAGVLLRVTATQPGS